MHKITIFATVTRLRIFITALMALMLAATATAQDKKGDNPEDNEVDMDNPTFVPMVKVGKVLIDGDSIQYVELNNVYVYPQPVFKNAKQRAAYNRLVYNVKKVLPIAKEVNRVIIETYEYLQTLPNKKSTRRAHEARGGRHQEEIHAKNEEAVVLAGQAAHKASLSRVQLIGLRPYTLVHQPIRAGFYQLAWLRRPSS